MSHCTGTFKRGLAGQGNQQLFGEKKFLQVAVLS